MKVELNRRLAAWKLQCFLAMVQYVRPVFSSRKPGSKLGWTMNCLIFVHFFLATDSFHYLSCHRFICWVGQPRDEHYHHGSFPDRIHWVPGDAQFTSRPTTSWVAWINILKFCCLYFIPSDFLLYFKKCIEDSWQSASTKSFKTMWTWCTTSTLILMYDFWDDDHIDFAYSLNWLGNHSLWINKLIINKAVNLRVLYCQIMTGRGPPDLRATWRQS